MESPKAKLGSRLGAGGSVPRRGLEQRSNRSTLGMGRNSLWGEEARRHTEPAGASLVTGGLVQVTGDEVLDRKVFLKSGIRRCFEQLRRWD